MFGWLADRFSPTNEASGPLGSAKTVLALISELDAETPQHALKELAKHFKDTPRELLTTPRGSRALQQLDEWAQRPVAELWGSLLADSQGQSVSEEIWSALTHYYRRSYASYWVCLGPHTASEGSSKREQANTMIIAARAMAALARYMLLLRMRYFSVPGEAWSHVWSLSGWAEQRGSATDRVEPYPGAAMNMTIERELLTALLIEVAPTANLLPAQILALDSLLRLHADHYRISDRYDAQANAFAYEPSRNAPPQRWLPGLQIRPEVRFFGVGDAYAELCKARDEAGSLRSLPQWLRQARCSADDYAGLLDRLVVRWSPEPPRRRHQSEPCTGEILVAHNWADIRRLVKFSELAITGRSLGYDTNVYRINSTVRGLSDSALSNPHASQPVIPKEALANLLSFEKSMGNGTTETWNLTDSSESGIGATAESDCAWVTVGMVVAYRRRESVDWQIALVRRLNRSANGRLSIGMARIGNKVCSARLRLGVEAVDYSKSITSRVPDIEYDALMPQDAVSTLLLPVGVFDQTRKYTLTCEDRQHVVKMEKSLERGPNFERIEISTVEMLRAA